MATTKQAHFLASLIRKVEAGVDHLPADQSAPVNTALANLRGALTLCESGAMSNGDASKVIDQAKALAEAFATVVPDPVKFRKLDSGAWGLYGPATVLIPGTEVPVTKRDGAVESKPVGDIVTGPDGKGNVLVTIGKMTPVVIPDGIYVVPGTGLFQSEGNHYVDKWIPNVWTYVGRPPVALDSSMLADARTARAIGWLVGRCCFGGHPLSNSASLVAGYGPTCAKNHGLPWGSVEVPDADVVLTELLYLATLDVGVTEDYARQRAAQFSDRLAREA